MITKDKVLNVLEENINEYVSGEDLASKLNLSRTAIWKAIKTLKGRGYKIESITSRGYRLKDSSDVLSEDKIKNLIKANLNVVVMDSVDSTNTYAKRIGEESYEPTLIVANSQTRGKGRMGRFFYSPKGSGVYFTLLLKPKIDISQSVLLTTLAAVSVACEVEKMLGKEVKIKWVNDLLIDNKKFCGILTEGSISIENSELNYAVIGIGINVYSPAKGFPKDISNIATSLLGSSNISYDFKNKLVANVVNNFMQTYSNIEKSPHLNAYKQRSIAIGKIVNVIKLDKEENAKVLDLGDDFSLIVEYEDGSIENLKNGEIRIKI